MKAHPCASVRPGWEEEAGEQVLHVPFNTGLTSPLLGDSRQNHGTVWVRRVLKDHPVPTPLPRAERQISAACFILEKSLGLNSQQPRQAWGHPGCRSGSAGAAVPSSAKGAQEDSAGSGLPRAAPQEAQPRPERGWEPADALPQSRSAGKASFSGGSLPSPPAQPRPVP